jgi:predicted DNA-binding transcriptional regulator AlpA
VSQVELAKKAAAAAAENKAKPSRRATRPPQFSAKVLNRSPRRERGPQRRNYDSGDDPDPDGSSAVRLISKPELLERLGVSYPTVWYWMREGRFPRSRELGGKACWIESEVAEWIAALPKTRLKGDEAE